MATLGAFEDLLCTELKKFFFLGLFSDGLGGHRWRDGLFQTYNFFIGLIDSVLCALSNGTSLMCFLDRELSEIFAET